MASRTKRTKCDIQRPCTLCKRAGIECRTGPVDQFRPFRSSDEGVQARLPPRRSTAARHDEPEDTSHLGDQPWSSSTMSLVSGAFELHNSTSPDVSLTTAMPGGHEPLVPHTSTMANAGLELRTDRPYAPRSIFQGSRAVTMELVSLLPSRDTAALLVDTYFDRVHWFMLIFHQEDFRQKWQTLYEISADDLVETAPDIAMISTLLLVIAIAAQYAGEYRQQILKARDVNLTALKDNILTVIRSRLLDIVSIGSIESVQTCVLLGTYYLYNGSPNLAWPVCGCGLRVAQALGLHRKVPIIEPVSIQARKMIETRKRCWWAIYEIETFCSISYGYPHGIVDTDCTVGLLDPSPIPIGASPINNAESCQCPDSLLSYKYLMSKLSIFLKDTLTDLYGIGSRQSDNRKGQTLFFDLKELLRKIPLLDRRLQQWKAELPNSLHLDRSNPTYHLSLEDMDRDIGASGPVFDSHIFQLQALALALAYKNARILVHRPLLTYRTKFHVHSGTDGMADTLANAVRASMLVCKEAAMNTAKIGESPIFNLAADTYAASFISIHTFTAGVLLCVLTSIEPLTSDSHQLKVGLRWLQLARLLMENELRVILGAGNDSSLKPRETTHDGCDDLRNLNDSLDPRPVGVTEANDAPGVSGPANENAIQRASTDFDEVYPVDGLDMPLEPFFVDFNVPSNGFTQEQAWIWGLEDPVTF
ncbi:fungal-specific transcription factor domain-containing protein [Penicillium verhagenii]|nr:fungal-specific transcription factor domain-containing protein [Penicillium verhagenii]